MRHTSDPEDETITGAVPRLASSLSGIVKEPLRFPPGQKTLYTSWGYTALGCVIETVSGESYAEFVTRNILTPASMRQTTFDEPAYAAPNFSPGFRMAGGSLQPSLVVDTRFKMPASGMISTVNDLALFAIALFERRLLPEPIFREMLSTRPATDDERPMFTTGWTLVLDRLGTPAFNYTGSMEGTTAISGDTSRTPNRGRASGEPRTLRSWRDPDRPRGAARSGRVTRAIAWRAGLQARHRLEGGPLRLATEWRGTVRSVRCPSCSRSRRIRFSQAQ